jgi:hypothetical protein
MASPKITFWKGGGEKSAVSIFLIQQKFLLHIETISSQPKLHTCTVVGVPTLAPKIPCAFLPNSAIFDIVGKINLSKIKSMRI